jgi:hypothetical protein
MMAILITIFIAVVIVGLLYWLITFLPLPAPFDQIARGILVIGLILFIIVELWSLRGALPK